MEINRFRRLSVDIVAVDAVVAVKTRQRRQLKDSLCVHHADGLVHRRNLLWQSILHDPARSFCSFHSSSRYSSYLHTSLSLSLSLSLLLLLCCCCFQSQGERQSADRNVTNIQPEIDGFFFFF